MCAVDSVAVRTASVAAPGAGGAAVASLAETESSPKTTATEVHQQRSSIKIDISPPTNSDKEITMTGRVVIVTGASSGLGFETARYLCEGGNDVILACRDEEKTNRAIARIKQQNPNALANYMHLDLANLESIRKFADEFHSGGKQLNVLVNNAGVALNFKDTKRQYTKDNFELTMGTNHLGPFLLTNLLLDDLKKAASGGGEARIVIVTSSLHDPKASKKTRNLQPIDWDDFFLFKDGSFNGLQAYKNSKAANIMFAYELDRRLVDSGVKVNAVCPGIVPCTDLLRNASGAQKLFARYILHGVLRFAKLTRSVPQGAASISALATDEKFKDVTGKYFKELLESTPSEEASNADLQARLWELSGRYTSLEGYEPLAVPPPPKDEEEKKQEETKEEGKVEKTEEGTKENGVDEKNGGGGDEKKTEQNSEEEKGTKKILDEKKEDDNKP